MNCPACCFPVTSSTSLHADPLQQLQRVIDHRPAAYRQQVLVRHARQLLEPGRRAACADEPFHDAADATAGPRSVSRCSISQRGRKRRARHDAGDDRRMRRRRGRRARPTGRFRGRTRASRRPPCRRAESRRRAPAARAPPRASADANSGAARDDQHQRVARPGAEIRADVEAVPTPKHTSPSASIPIRVDERLAVERLQQVERPGSAR